MTAPTTDDLFAFRHGQDALFMHRSGTLTGRGIERAEEAAKARRALDTLDGAGSLAADEALVWLDGFIVAALKRAHDRGQAVKRDIWIALSPHYAVDRSRLWVCGLCDSPFPMTGVPRLAALDDKSRRRHYASMRCESCAKGPQEPESPAARRKGWRFIGYANRFDPDSPAVVARACGESGCNQVITRTVGSRGRPAEFCEEHSTPAARQRRARESSPQPD